MEKIFNNTDKIFELIPGGFFGIFAVFIGLLGDFLSIMLYPGYNFTVNMVSDLSVGQGAIFFNLFTIMSGLSGIFFYSYLGKSFKKEGNFDGIKKIAIYFALISCFLMAMVGFFPSIFENQTIIFLHYITTLFCFLTAIIYLFSFSYITWTDQIFSRRLTPFCLFPGALTIIYGLIVFFDANTPISVNFVPPTEWILVLSIMAWTGVISSFSLYNKL